MTRRGDAHGRVRVPAAPRIVGETCVTTSDPESGRNLVAMVDVEPCMMTAAASSRRYYVVGEGASVRPRFDAARPLRDNVTAIAAWEWGERRAAGAADLADQVAVQAIDDQAEWTAAILCAAAADSGRDRKPGWYRTLTAISEMTGVAREAMLARYAQLATLRQAS